MIILTAAETCLFVLPEAGLCSEKGVVQQLILAQLSNNLSLPPLLLPGRLVISSPRPDSGRLDSPKLLLVGRCLWRSEVLAAQRRGPQVAGALQESNLPSFLLKENCDFPMHLMHLRLAVLAHRSAFHRKATLQGEEGDLWVFES